MIKTFLVIDKTTEKSIAEGCILPDGQTAIAWLGDKKTHGCYPSFEAFKSIKDKQPSREIVFGEHSMDCYHLNTFRLERESDVTGISGTGIVARGCFFYGADVVVMQWMTEIPSTFWYPHLNLVEELHGHGGATKLVMDTILSTGKTD